MDVAELRSGLADLMADSRHELQDRFVEWIDKHMEPHGAAVDDAIRRTLEEIISTLIDSIRDGRYENILLRLKDFVGEPGFEQAEAGLRAFRTILVNEVNRSMEDVETKHRTIELVYKDFDVILDGISRLYERMYALRLEKRIEERTAELLETRGLYKGLVENSPIGVCILQDGKIGFANDEFARISGYGKEEIIGFNYRLLLAPQSLENHREGIERRLVGLDGPLTYRAKGLRKDGSSVEVEICSVPTTFKGKPATQGLVRDISREKKIEQLRQSFFSNVSHELRTPLTTVSGYIKFLLGGKMGNLNQSQVQALQAANEEADKLDRLIDTIIELSSLDSESFRLHLGDVDIARVTGETARSKESQAKHKELRLEVNLPKNLPHVVGDERRLELLMSNIIDNAVKFTPEGGTVKIAGYEEGSDVVIEISDTGIGIPKDEQSKIFDRFYQVDSSPTRMYGGAGLGLSICEEIADLHGGRIEVESDAGKGTTFKVRLPREGKPE